MSWTQHVQVAGRRVVWLSDDVVQLAIAVDARGVHPRLDARDHRERTCLEDLEACKRYWTERDLEVTEPDAVDILIIASAVRRHLAQAEEAVHV